MPELMGDDDVAYEDVRPTQTRLGMEGRGREGGRTKWRGGKKEREGKREGKGKGTFFLNVLCFFPNLLLSSSCLQGHQA
jgi:hypothetical protein